MIQARSPLFIVFDGMDGSGKTTQMHRLAERLRALGQPVVTTCEPTGNPDGVRLRQALSGQIPATLQQMAAMFLLDRIGHNQNPESGIEKYLSDGCTVLCDRYYYASMAYQGGDDPASFRWVADMNRNCPAIRHPDGCICFDLDPETAMRRITAGRSPEQLEIYETVSQQARIRERFRRVREMLADEELIITVDAGGTPDEVAEGVFAAYLRIAAAAGKH